MFDTVRSSFEMNWLVWWAVIVGTIGVVKLLQLDYDGSVEMNGPNVEQNLSIDTQVSGIGAKNNDESPLIRSVE